MRAESFAELLDAALGRGSGETARRPAPSAAARIPGGAPRTASAFLFTRPLTAAVPRWPAAAGAGPRPRPDHPFSHEERRAFDRLLDLGARLEANFGADDLRREYRRLAHLYHPDRHSSGSDVEQGSLARLFAELTERYRTLRALVEPRH